MSKELTVSNAAKSLPAEVGIFSDISTFESAQRMAQALTSSDMVPKQYKGNMGNSLIALDISRRTGANPLMVMQNLHVIEGKPSWSSPFIIAALNSSRKFSPLRFDVKDLGEKEVEYEYWTGSREQNNRRKETRKIKIHNKRYVASATDRSGERLEGPEVTIEMAVKEGWYTKNGSKWQTMPDLMGRYRAAAFFGRLYAPEILMGIPMEEEIYDLPADQFQVVTEEAAKPAPKIVEPVDEDPADKPKPSRGRPSKAQLEQAEKDGYRAFHGGLDKEEVPDDVPSVQSAWVEGWEKAEQDVENEPAADNGEDGSEPIEAEAVKDDSVPFDPDHDEDNDDQSGFGFGD